MGANNCKLESDVMPVIDQVFELQYAEIALMIVNCQRVQDISDRLHLSPKTVNTYRYRLFDKLHVTSDVELTHLALRHGLVEGFDATMG